MAMRILRVCLLTGTRGHGLVACAFNVPLPRVLPSMFSACVTGVGSCMTVAAVWSASKHFGVPNRKVMLDWEVEVRKWFSVRVCWFVAAVDAQMSDVGVCNFGQGVRAIEACHFVAQMFGLGAGCL